MILAFPDVQRRHDFAELLRREREDIWRVCHEAYTLPHLILPDLNSEQSSWIMDHIPEFGKAHQSRKRVLFSAHPSAVVP